MLRLRRKLPGRRSRPFSVLAEPAHLIEGGVPTEALLAQVAVAKFSEHMPLYRQSQVFARHGIMLDRAVLADWMGTTAFHLAPLVERMSVLMKLSGRLFMDETTAPVLDPGRGRTKTGYLWAVLRDDRGHGGADPPIVVYHYAPGRGGEHAERILEGFDGVLQVDGYGGYHRLARPGRKGGAPLRLAWCWSHGRREIIGATPKAGSPVAEAILARIAALYAIEAEIRGKEASIRQSVRAKRSRPLVAELEDFLRAQATRLSGRSEMGKAVAYLLNHWVGLTLFLEDGRVEMDTNLVENQMRPLTLTRKNALFAGHDEGGRSWSRLASLIATALCRARHKAVYAARRTMPNGSGAERRCDAGIGPRICGRLGSIRHSLSLRAPPGRQAGCRSAGSGLTCRARMVRALPELLP